MENIEPVYENRVSLNKAFKRVLGGIGGFVGGLFILNAKSAAVVSGGLIMGVLTGIPVIGWAGILWAMLFGAFTVFLYIRRSAQPAQYVDGVVLGAIAGTIGSFVQLMFSLALGVLYLIFAGFSSAVQPRRADP